MRQASPFRALLSTVLIVAAAACSRSGPTTTQPDGTASTQAPREASSGQDAGSAPPNVAANGAPASPPSFSPRERSRRDRVVTVQAGTELAVRLDEPVSSATASAAQEVAGELAAPLGVNGEVLAGTGTPVRTRVESVVPSGRLGRTARLVLTLTAVRLGSEWAPIVTSDLVRTGQAHAKRNERFVGGGAAIGAIVGQLLGGNTKSTLRGAAAGAAAGTGAAAATGRLDVEVGAGEVLRFVLRKPLTARPS